MEIIKKIISSQPYDVAFEIKGISSSEQIHAACRLINSEIHKMYSKNLKSNGDIIKLSRVRGGLRISADLMQSVCTHKDFSNTPQL